MQGYAGYINLINSSFLPKTKKRYILFLPNTVVVYKTGPLYWLSIEKLKGAQISSSKPTDIFAAMGLLHALSRIFNLFKNYTFKRYSQEVLASAVWDQNSVSLSGTKTKVQFQYWFRSRNFFFCQIFLIFPNLFLKKIWF